MHRLPIQVDSRLDFGEMEMAVSKNTFSSSGYLDVDEIWELVAHAGITIQLVYLLHEHTHRCAYRGIDDRY